MVTDVSESRFTLVSVNVVCTCVSQPFAPVLAESSAWMRAVVSGEGSPTSGWKVKPPDMTMVSCWPPGAWTISASVAPSDKVPLQEIIVTGAAARVIVIWYSVNPRFSPPTASRRKVKTLMPVARALAPVSVSTASVLGMVNCVMLASTGERKNCVSSTSLGTLAVYTVTVGEKTGSSVPDER